MRWNAGHSLTPVILNFREGLTENPVISLSRLASRRRAVSQNNSGSQRMLNLS
jgi:hypothetical protein